MSGISCDKTQWFQKFNAQRVSFCWVIWYLILIISLCLLPVDLFNTSISHYRWRLRTCSLTVIFSSRKSTVLIHNASRQVCNAPCSDRKIIDLCRLFRLTSSVYATKIHVSYVHSCCSIHLRSRCTRREWCIYSWYLSIITSDSCHCYAIPIYISQWKSQ